MAKLLLGSLAFLFDTHSFAQKSKERFYFSNDFSLIQEGDTSYLASAGGLLSPVFFSLDVDFDGKEEVFILDQRDDALTIAKSVTENGKTHWEVLRDQATALPPIGAFINCMDMDGDGLKDVITGDNAIKVYHNESNDSLRFSEKYTSFKYFYEGKKESISITVGEQPSFVDMNFDGKIDMVVFDELGERLLYYKNISTKAREYLFELESTHWGFFKESGLNFDIELGVFKKGHPGSKIVAFDQNDDQDVDLLITDNSSTSIYFLENGKSDLNLTVDSIITLDKNFPSSDVSAEIYSFPSLHLLDADADGDLDLVSANSFINPVSSGQIWLYTNGDNAGFDFTLTTKSYLQELMIDRGIAASTAMIDVDLDGDMDLLVAGTNHEDEDPFKAQRSSISYYENIGSEDHPAFELKEENVLSLTDLNLDRFNINVGDIDNDGDDDLLLGLSNGQVYYYMNTGDGGINAIFSPFELIIEDLDVGSDAFPCVYDVNKDNINDLVIGRGAGYLSYYKGLGDAKFELITEKWGAVRTSSFYWSFSYDSDGNKTDSQRVFLSSSGSTAPTIADIDGNGYPELMVGSSSGEIYYYPDIDPASEGRFNRDHLWYYNQHLNKNENPRLGKTIRPHFTQLVGGDSWQLLVGTYYGGIQYFKTKITPVSLESVHLSSLDFDIFPNPTTGKFSLKNNLDEQTLVTVYTLQGQEIKRIGLGVREIKMTILPKGIYIIGSDVGFKKVIVY